MASTFSANKSRTALRTSSSFSGAKISPRESIRSDTSLASLLGIMGSGLLVRTMF